MPSGRYKYLCIKEDNTVEIISSQCIEKILDEYDEYDNPFVSIIRQEVDWGHNDCKTTSWSN